MEIINLYIDQFVDIRPVDECFDFISHHTDLTTMLKSLHKCNRKMMLAFSALQGVLNISLTLKDENISPEQKINVNWHLEFRILFQVTSPLEQITVITRRGSQHPYYDVLEEYFSVTLCVNYVTYTKYDPSLLTIVDWQSWLAVVTTGFVIAFVTQSLSKGFSVLMFSLGKAVNEKRFNRRLILCFLIPISFHYNIYQSFISSDSTRLRDLPYNIHWYMIQNFKVSFPVKHSIEFLYYYVLPNEFKLMFDQLLTNQNVFDYLAYDEVPITNISHMARHMAETKIGIGNYFEKYTFFTSIIDKNIALIDGTYACFQRKTQELADLAKISFRFTGYLSKKTQWAFTKLMESGDAIKFDKLSKHLLSLRRSLSSTDVKYLDKTAPPQAIDSKSIVGLSCITVFCVGIVVLLVGIFVQSLQILITFVIKFYNYLTNRSTCTSHSVINNPLKSKQCPT